MTAASKAAADLASTLPMDDPLAQVARMVLESHARTATKGRAMDEPVQIGSKLRDASRDPLPGDFLVPVNAGEADPHGPLVRSLVLGTPEGDAAIAARRKELGIPLKRTF